ncbi:hypothetical protein VIBNISOn1_1490002 [Vibrio nigripulchritudo SOn1]|uniref:Uncharacterized protein n=2 Tax=Vibrio nigripulchritudo TaxID=28173 RepID=A0AAV2VLD8_9VIBR|nr:hypothetical protein VIBNISOn1_1490002 [Vibrio nigripulchritudo SOn1]
MLNIYRNGAIDSLVANALSTDFVKESDFKRVKYSVHDKLRFDIYLTIAYLGFYGKEQHSYHSVLESVPKEFLPCEVDQSETFHITNTSVSRIVTQFTPFLKANLSFQLSDTSVIRDIQDNLPMTLDQINSELIERGVTDQAISETAVSFLFESINNGVETSSFIVYKSGQNKDANGERFERNARPSITAFSHLEHEKDMKAISRSVIRYCETLGRLVGVVNFDLVESLLERLNTPVLDLVATERSAVYKFCRALCFEKYGSESSVYAIDDELQQSEFYELMYKYLRSVGTCTISNVPQFLTRILEFKAIRKAKESSRVISSSVILDYWDEKFISSQVSMSLVCALDFVSISGDEKSFGIDSSVFVDIEQESNIVLSVLLDYLSANGGLPVGSDSERKTTLMLQSFSSLMRTKLIEAKDNPSGFFEKSKEGFSVSKFNIRTREDLSGAYIRPDYDYISEELYNERVINNEDESELKSRFTVLFESFKKRWNKVVNQSNLMVDDSLKGHEDYLAERREILTTTHHRKCENWIRTEIKRANSLIKSYHAFIKYLVAQDETKNAASIHHLELRIEKWNEILEICELDMELIYSSEPYKAHIRHIEEVNRLLEARSKLAIKPSQYRAHIAIHDFILKHSSGPFMSEQEVNQYIDDYCASLTGVSTASPDKKLVSNYHNLRRLFRESIEKHPFALIEPE